VPLGPGAAFPKPSGMDGGGRLEPLKIGNRSLTLFLFPIVSGGRIFAFTSPYTTRNSQEPQFYQYLKSSLRPAEFIVVFWNPNQFSKIGLPKV
jgi:hypothetical protein